MFFEHCLMIKSYASLGLILAFYAIGDNILINAQCVIFENEATLPFLMPADFTACPKTANRPDLLLLALRRY